MSTSEQIQEHTFERRSEPRKKALIHAFVSDREDVVDLKCIIRDISKGGCRIATSYIQDLPRIIEIVPEGFDRPITGKIIWRNTKVAGVKFLSTEELAEFESEQPVRIHEAPSGGFFGKLQSLAGVRRRSGQITRDENREPVGIPNFGMRVLHGVRNPLTSIKSLLSLLMGDTIRPIPKRARTIIKTAHENAEKAERLVEEALHAGEMKSGDLPCKPIPVELVALVSNAALVNTGFAAKNDVRFEVKDDVGKAMVMADPVRLEEVLTNLLSSAAKYSPIGEMVTVAITRIDGSIRVAVSDRGIGSNVWHGDADGKHGGDEGDAISGLGLDICQNVLEQHGTEMQIDARPGSGTTIWFQLPEIDQLEQHS
jgi:signal transduction histidine kinase